MKFVYKRKPNYYETDQMKIIHHSNYIRWFEEARVAFMEHIGCPFEEIENGNFQIPVTEVSSKYLKPVKFDDMVDIHIYLSYYNGVRIKYTYEVYNQNGELCNTGFSSHCITTKEGKVLNIKKALPKEHAMFTENLKRNESNI